jgi:exopolyphosphatase/guanosine-5'-triphosphate,3'-diphosphate pyrophosphatase
MPREKHAEFATLDPEDQHRVRVLAGLLRIAVALDRNHAGRVSSLSCRTDGDGALVVEIEPAPGADVSLELYAANERTDLLSEVLGRPVTVVAPPPPELAAVGDAAASMTAASSMSAGR